MENDDLDQTLRELQTELARDLLERIKSGKANAADRNVARRLCPHPSPAARGHMVAAVCIDRCAGDGLADRDQRRAARLTGRANPPS